MRYLTHSILFVVTGVIAVFVLGSIYLNHCGAAAWEATERQLIELGEPITIAEIRPEAVADERNFARAPIFAELFEEDYGNGRLEAVEGFRGVKDRGASDVVNFARRVDPDFDGSDEDAARVILEVVEGERELWDEVQAAAERPETAWPVNYEQGFAMDLPQLTALLRLGQSLGAQAQARLLLSDSEGAADDVELILNLAERSREPRILIAQLLRISMVMLAIQTVATGIEQEGWSDEELVAFQEAFGAMNLVEDLRVSLRGERVVSLATMKSVTAKAFTAVDGIGLSDESAGLRAVVVTWPLRPEGLFDEDRASMVDLTQRILDGVEEPETWPSEESALKTEVRERKGNFVEFFRTPLTNQLTESLFGVAKRTLFAQQLVELAGVACALERFRLREGVLPVDLAELVPDFLPEVPTDLMSGDWVRYRRGPGGDFALYALGWNCLDDGGDGKGLFGSGKDWVWREW